MAMEQFIRTPFRRREKRTLRHSRGVQEVRSLVPTLALPRSGLWVVALGATSQPGQIPSSPLRRQYTASSGRCKRADGIGHGRTNIGLKRSPGHRKVTEGHDDRLRGRHASYVRELTEHRPDSLPCFSDADTAGLSHDDYSHHHKFQGHRYFPKRRIPGIGSTSS